MRRSDKFCQARVLSSKARAPYMVLMEATLGHVEPSTHQLSSLQLLVASVSLLLLAQVEDKPLAEETTARRGPEGQGNVLGW